MIDATARPPAHDVVGGATRALEACSIVIALSLLIANLVHVVVSGLVQHWWSPVVVIVAALFADFVSGVVHWTADTWFSETMPVLGRRFLRPFRVHHVNPDDFLRRDVIDCNGDVAMLNIPILLTALLMPTSGASGAAALGLVAFSIVSLPTNQVHQWAHMPSAPPLVRWLQHRGIILSFEAHARHHRHPYLANYCIATGWCNRRLTRIDFFPRCERLISRITRLEPRTDEQRFHERW